jgi:hypothetical protein
LFSFLPRQRLSADPTCVQDRRLPSAVCRRLFTVYDSTAKSHLNHREHKEHKELQEKHPRLSVFIRGWKSFLQ